MPNFTAAWKAFWRKEPDIYAAAAQQFQEQLAQERAKVREARASIDKLDPFCRSTIDSIAGNTTNAEALFSRQLPEVQSLPFSDQLEIMRFIVERNPRVTLYPTFRYWASRNGPVLWDALFNLTR